MNLAPAADIVDFYNTWQLPFAFLITLLIAVGQYFKYRNTDIKEFVKRIALSFIVSIVLTALMVYVLNYNTSPQPSPKERGQSAYYLLLMFSSIFATVANADYMIRVLKGKVLKAGASIAHIGFGLLLLGALISTSKKEIISQNTSGKSIESLGESFSNNDNILLTQGDTLPMGKYFVTYLGKRFEGINIYFDVDYFSRNSDGSLKKEFSLSPLVQTNPRMGNVAEPDTRHFLTYDVYTHVTYADLESLKEKKVENLDEYAVAKDHTMHVGDTIFSSNAIIILDSLSTRIDKTKFNIGENDIAVMANLRVLDIRDKYKATPLYVIRNSSVQPIASKVDELGLQFMFWKIDTETGAVQISLQEKKSNVRDFIVMQAMVFPYINILWLGCFIMIIGTVLAIVERVRKGAGL